MNIGASTIYTNQPGGNLVHKHKTKNWTWWDCKTVVFFSKSVKESVKRGVRVLRARSARASHARRVCEAREKNRLLLSVFSLVPDLLFDCSLVLEYARIRTVLQSRRGGRTTRYKVYPNQLNKPKREENFATSKRNPHFLKLSLRDGANHLIFQPECPVFPCKW